MPRTSPGTSLAVRRRSRRPGLDLDLGLTERHGPADARFPATDDVDPDDPTLDRNRRTTRFTSLLLPVRPPSTSPSTRGQRLAPDACDALEAAWVANDHARMSLAVTLGGQIDGWIYRRQKRAVVTHEEDVVPALEPAPTSYDGLGLEASVDEAGPSRPSSTRSLPVLRLRRRATPRTTDCESRIVLSPPRPRQSLFHAAVDVEGTTKAKSWSSIAPSSPPKSKSRLKQAIRTKRPSAPIAATAQAQSVADASTLANRDNPSGSRKRPKLVVVWPRPRPRPAPSSPSSAAEPLPEQTPGPTTLRGVEHDPGAVEEGRSASGRSQKQIVSSQSPCRSLSSHSLSSSYSSSSSVLPQFQTYQPANSSQSKRRVGPRTRYSTRPPPPPTITFSSSPPTGLPASPFVLSGRTESSSESLETGAWPASEEVQWQCTSTFGEAESKSTEPFGPVPAEQVWHPYLLQPSLDLPLTCTPSSSFAEQHSFHFTSDPTGFEPTFSFPSSSARSASFSVPGLRTSTFDPTLADPAVPSPPSGLSTNGVEGPFSDWRAERIHSPSPPSVDRDVGSVTIGSSGVAQIEELGPSAAMWSNILESHALDPTWNDVRFEGR